MIKKFLIVAILGLVLSSAAKATTWFDAYGNLVSNTCYAPGGAWFVFGNRYGPVGAPCWFHMNGYNFQGVFG